MAKMVIKRFGIFSAAKIYAVVMAGIGLLVGIPLGLFMIVFGAAMMTGAGREAAAGAGIGIGVGIFYMIGLPVIYAIMGFVFGAIGAAIYNVAARTIGGVEMELENADTNYAAPPSPNWGDQPPYTPGQQQQYPY